MIFSSQELSRLYSTYHIKYTKRVTHRDGFFHFVSYTGKKISIIVHFFVNIAERYAAHRTQKYYRSISLHLINLRHKSNRWQTRDFRTRIQIIGTRSLAHVMIQVNWKRQMSATIPTFSRFVKSRSSLIINTSASTKMKLLRSHSSQPRPNMSN